MSPRAGEIGGAAYWLWEQAEAIEWSAEHLTDEIADLESKIVKAREERDRLRLIRAEMLAARNLIETAGLKVERRGRDVVVSVEHGDGGHRTAEPHDCFSMNCKALGSEVESLRAALAEPQP